MHLLEPTSFERREEHLQRDKRRRLIAAGIGLSALLLLWFVRGYLAQLITKAALRPERCSSLPPGETETCYRALGQPLVESIIVGLSWLALGFILLPGALSPGAVMLLPMAVLLLWTKLTPVFEPRNWGTMFASYVSGEMSLWSFLATRGAVPWLAAHLGFGSQGGWQIFLFVLFLLGLLRLYTGILNLTGSPVFSLLVSLIPATSITGWYSVIIPGYPDWCIFCCIAFALFAAGDWTSLGSAAIALLSHERSAVIVIFVPLLRALLRPPTRRRRMLFLLAVALGQILLFFVLRRLFVPTSPLNMGFYLQEAVQGSQFAAEPCTLTHLAETIWASHKAHLILAGAALVSLRSGGRALLAKLGLPATLAAVVLQLFLAVDSVRLLDLLVFPIIVSLCLLCCTRQRMKTPLVIGLTAAHLFNLVSPVVYLSRNWNFQPPSRMNLLDI